MRLITTLVFMTVLAISASAQTSVGMHFGTSNKNLVAGLDAQHKFDNKLFLGLNLTTHLDSKNPAMFQSRAGVSFGENVAVAPYIGYCYRITSVDKGDYGSYLAGGVQLKFKLNDQCLIYTDFNVIRKYQVLTIGIAGIL